MRSVTNAKGLRPDHAHGGPKIPATNSSRIPTLTANFQLRFLFMKTTNALRAASYELKATRRMIARTRSSKLAAFYDFPSSAVVTDTTDARLISSFRLSGGTRKVSASSLMLTIVPRSPPLVTTLSPFFNSPSMACHFFCFRCCGIISRK